MFANVLKFDFLILEELEPVWLDKMYILPPVLYRGGFSQSVMNEYTDGNTTLSENPGKFKGREGIVITPTTERRCEIGRVIFKSISVDYLSRKNPKDN
jgi:hypothetical protein